MENNKLVGSIPESFGFMVSVERLLLSGNMLTGTVPESIGELDHLNELTLHDNMMSGEIGAEICDLSLETLTADCDEVGSNISCSCCTFCK